ncbi:MAG TPA: hypothetical protein VF791_14190 [Pyrinomonadaceae bacterium]
MLSRRLLYAFALAALFLLPVSAQTPDDQSTLNQQEKQQKALELKKELERKTFVLLDEIIQSAATLKLPENRALVLAGAADLLWASDDKRARALFRDALANLRAATPRFEEKMSDEQRRFYWMLTQQRKEILQMVARRDADFALELLRASRQQPPQATAQGSKNRSADDEHRMEQSLINQIAINDPKRAFQMAEDSLSKGASFELLKTLAYLNDRDKELAGRLATDIISKLRSESLTTNNEAAWTAMMLLRMGLQPEGEGLSVSFGSVYIPKTPFRLDERQQRDLLEMITTAALSGTPNPSILNFLPQFITEVEKRFPDRVPLLRRRITESLRTLEPRERMYVEHQELIQRGSIEDLLAAAAKASEKESVMLYENAAWKAFNRGDEEHARKIINDHVKDASSRERILESFERAALWTLMRKEKLDEVRRMMARIKSKEERAAILGQLALGAAIKKDRKLALELLDEARPLLSLKPKNDTQLYPLLQVIRVYALVEPAKAFEMIESLVDQANELLAAASVLNGFLLPSGVFKKGELVLAPGYSQVTAQFRQFGKEIAALAIVNFDRTKAAADKFQRNETRTMARLFIAQGILSEQLGSSAAIYEGGIVMGY